MLGLTKLSVGEKFRFSLKCSPDTYVKPATRRVFDLDRVALLDGNTNGVLQTIPGPGFLEFDKADSRDGENGDDYVTFKVK
jgi:hypothetical protein